MKDLKNLLNTVAIATAEETVENIQAGVLSIVRNNSDISFSIALKLLTMATNLKDHNTVVKLNKMLESYYPIGESMEEILEAVTPEETILLTDKKAPLDNEAFDKMGDYIKNFMKTQLPSGGNDLAERIAQGLDTIMGANKEEMSHVEDITLPFPIDTLEIEDLNEEFLEAIKKVESSYQLIEESNVVDFVKAVIRKLKLHQLYSIGDSVITHIVDYYTNLFNKNTEVVLAEISDDMARMRETLFAAYVLNQLQTNAVKGSPLYRYLQDAIDAVEETLNNGGWSEVINYENKWAVLCNDDTIVATAQDYEDAFCRVDETSTKEAVRLAEVEKEDLSKYDGGLANTASVDLSESKEEKVLTKTMTAAELEAAKAAAATIE